MRSKKPEGRAVETTLTGLCSRGAWAHLSFPFNLWGALDAELSFYLVTLWQGWVPGMPLLHHEGRGILGTERRDGSRQPRRAQGGAPGRL